MLHNLTEYISDWKFLSFIKIPVAILTDMVYYFSVVFYSNTTIFYCKNDCQSFLYCMQQRQPPAMQVEKEKLK